jgi:hypothetical protein
MPLGGMVDGKGGAFLPAYEVGEVVAGEVGSARVARSLLRMRGIREPSSVSADQS